MSERPHKSLGPLKLQYFFGYKTEFFFFQNNPKDLDPSYKPDEPDEVAHHCLLKSLNSQNDIAWKITHFLKRWRCKFCPLLFGTFIPTAVRAAKTGWSFGHSECNRVEG